MIDYSWIVYLSTFLFALGIINILVKKDGINFIIGIEMIINAALINFVSGSAYLLNENGAVYALFTLVVAALETTLIVALLLLYSSRTGGALFSSLRNLRG